MMALSRQMRKSILAVASLVVCAAASVADDLLTLDDPDAPVATAAMTAAGAVAGAPPRGVKLDCYLHFYGETLPQLEAFVRDKTKPDISLRLPEARSRNLWNPKDEYVVARLCGCVMSGWIVPEADGDYYLIVSDSPVPRRLFLAVDGAPDTAAEIELVPKPRYDRAEKAVSLESRHEWKTISRRAYANAEPLHLKAGEPLYFALHFLTSYAGEGLELTWAEVSGENLRRAIPTEVLRPERPKGTNANGK